jgi:hypothetical protein
MHQTHQNLSSYRAGSAGLLHAARHRAGSGDRYDSAAPGRIGRFPATLRSVLTLLVFVGSISILGSIQAGAQPERRVEMNHLFCSVFADESRAGVNPRMGMHGERWILTRADDELAHYEYYVTPTDTMTLDIRFGNDSVRSVLVRQDFPGGHPRLTMQELLQWQKYNYTQEADSVYESDTGFVAIRRATAGRRIRTVVKLVPPTLIATEVMIE